MSCLNATERYPRTTANDRLYTVRSGLTSLVYVDHAITKCPEQNVREEAIEKTVREESSTRAQERLPCSQRTDDKHRPENNSYNEVK